MGTIKKTTIDQKIGFWVSLRGRITGQLLLISLVPLIILSVLFFTSLNQAVGDFGTTVNQVRETMANEMIGTKLQTLAEETMAPIDTYMLERFHDIQEWAVTPIIITVLEETAREAEALASSGLDIEQIEARFENNRELALDSPAKAFLEQRLARNPAFKEVFFTDRHGYNVAVSNPTSDFVQSDETWWQVAWEKGTYISEVVYEESAEVYAVDMAMRIDHPDTGQALGVMKASLDITAIQTQASDIASHTAGAEVALFNADGYRIADSHSNHSPELIMTEAGNLFKLNYGPAKTVFEQEEVESGYLFDQASLHQTEGADVVGYARSAGADFYSDVPGFDGFNWGIVYLQPNPIAFQGMEPIIELESALNNLQNSTTTSVLTVVVLAAVGSVIFALFMANGISAPIVKLNQIANKIAAGHLDTAIDIQRRDEIGNLTHSLSLMTHNLRERIEAEQAANDKAQQLARADREAKEYLEQTVDNYLTFVERVAEGDLTARLSLNGDSDALTILGRNLNSMVGRLGEMTAQIREATAHISSAAAEILSATTQQASGANEQSAAISQTSTTIDEVKTIVEQSFSKAQAVAERAQRTSEVSQAGQRAVADTVESMEQIKEKVEGIAENILALSEQTQQIGEITATVNEIASQSNLLALNASVEAARAGEHGKGFAVVAVEVRNLAEQSRQATAQVKAILNEIQRATNAAVMATEEGTKGVDAGAQLTGQAGETIQQLASSIVESASAAQQIVASAQQQTTGMEQIALAMENINQATMQSLASTRQAEKAARDLSAVAQQMEALVAQYKLN